MDGMMNCRTAPLTLLLVSLLLSACNGSPFSVGGEVSGLNGTLMLENNSEESLTLKADGLFAFVETLPSGATYEVLVAQQPENQLCTVENGVGEITTEDVVDIQVICVSEEGGSYSVGGEVSGLAGSLVIENNAEELLTLEADGDFVFSETLSSGASYAVVVSEQPENQQCTVENGEGEITSEDVGDILVSCVDEAEDKNKDVEGSGEDTNTEAVVTDPPEAPVLTTEMGLKQLTVSWELPEGEAATYFQLMHNPDGNSGFTQLGEDISADIGSITVSIAVHLNDWLNDSYLLEACNEAGCTASETITGLDALGAIGYIKSNNTQSGNYFGNAVAISGDGKTLAISATGDSSSALGVDGDQSDTSLFNSGAVYLFEYTQSGWQQSAYIKSSASDENDLFGYALDLDQDGDTLVVSTPYEDSDADGINGDDSDNTAPNSGAAYVFSRTGDVWQQQAYIKASNSDGGSPPEYIGDYFGRAVTLSADGNTLAVGAPYEKSASNQINGDESDNSETHTGAVYLFVREGEAWSQQAYIKAANSGGGDLFGISLSLSDDGERLLVGAPYESGDATGINGNGDNDDVMRSGAAYLFLRSVETWTQQAYIKASNTEALDSFGYAVRLSGDGLTLAVGAPYEGSGATGVDGDDSDNSEAYSGALYVFAEEAGEWGQQAYLKSSNTGELDVFGLPVVLSEDGNLLVTAAQRDDSGADGVDGDGYDDSQPVSGAVYVFSRQADNSWQGPRYIKAPNSDEGDYFGIGLSLSDDGQTLVVGAPKEDSSAIGINSDQEDNESAEAGAVYLY